MKSLKFIEKGIMPDKLMNEICGGISSCGNLSQTPECPGRIFSSCYIKYTCPIYTDGPNSCRGFSWCEPEPVPTDTIK